jgi:hypothetical protein
MQEYLAERQQRQEEEVQIKVEEIEVEDYQITEPSTIISNSSANCYFCHNSDPFGLKQTESMSISNPDRDKFNHSCPSCGRFQISISTSLYKCPICIQKLTSIFNFREHFQAVHSRMIVAELKCILCKAFFFNEEARNIHGQDHCTSCKIRCMKDKQLLIPFEDHKKKCKNQTIRQNPVVNQHKNVTVKRLVTIPNNPRLDALKIRRVIKRGEKVQKIITVPYAQGEGHQKNAQVWQAIETDCTLCHSKLGVQQPPVRG